MKFIMQPATEGLSESEQTTFKERIIKRWRQLVGIAIALLIFSGFYNYLVIGLPQHHGDKRYHMLMGIKILLAFVVFFIASVLPGRAPVFENMRKHSKLWTSITIVLGLIVIVIASTLRVRGIPV